MNSLIQNTGTHSPLTLLLKKNLPYLLLILLFLLILGLLFAFNALITSKVPGGDLFRAQWAGARAFLVEGRNPYSATVIEQTQRTIYGRPAVEGEYPYRLQVPIYLLIFYFPFAYIENFELARALWMSFAELALFGIGWLSLQCSAWKPSRLNLALFFSALFLSFYGLYPLLDGDNALFAALLLLILWFVFQQGWDEVLGVLLLFGTIQLQQGGILFFYMLFLLLVQRRWRVFSILAMTLVPVIIVSLVFLPHWILPFLGGLQANLRAGDGFLWRETLQALSPERGELIFQLLRGMGIIALFLEWRISRHKDSQQLIWFAALSLSIMPFLGVRLTPALFPLLFLPLALVFQIAEDRWKHARWIISLILLAAFPLWLIPLHIPESLDLLFFAFPLFLTIALYWMRWWYFRPPRTWADRIR